MNFFIRLGTTLAFIAGTVTLLPTVATAAPSGLWPYEAQGRTLPASDWVLMIPGSRDENGDLSIWEDAPEWSEEWLVPERTPLGTQIVAVKGDAQDKRTVQAIDVDEMNVDAMHYLIEKYSAHTIAIAVQEENAGVAVAIWQPGQYAVWEEAFGYGNHKGMAVGLIDELLEENASIGGEVDVYIVGQRDSPMGMEYKIRVEDTLIMDVLQSLDALEIREWLSGEEIVVSPKTGYDIETALSSSGLRIGP